MKKLCTYLTLFVLGLLALAQPAAAADVTFYFKNPGNWTKPSIHWWKLGGGIVDNEQNGSSTPQAMTLVPGTTDVYYKTFTTNGADLTLDQAGLIFTSDSRWGDDISRIEFQSGKVKVGYLYNSDGTMSDAVYTPPVVQTTDYTFYVDASALNWTEVYAWLYEGDSTWKGISSGAEKTVSSTALGNGIFKFEVAGVVESGKAVFKNKPDKQWENEGAQKAAWEPKIQNGYIYRFTSTSATTGTEELYIVKPVVSATPASCTFYGSQSVTLSADKDGAKIYYTTDETEPSAANGTEYSAPLSFTETTTLKAVAILDGVPSEVLTATYTKGTPTVAVTASSSTFETSLEVTITATPSDAKIYYTTDGTEPSTDGTSYDSPVKFTITSTTTVKAIAVINGVKSEKKEGTFTKVKYSGSLYAKGPAFQGNWGSFTSLSGTNGVFSFDVKSADEFAISTSTEDSGIYMPVGIPTDDKTSFPFTVPTGEDNAKAIHKNYVFGKNFKAPAANGKIFIDMNDLKIWYEPKQETLPTQLWAKGPGASGSWTSVTELIPDGDGLFHFTAPSAGAFVISDTDNLDNFDTTAWGPVEGGTNTQVDVPTSMPEVANVEHAQQYGNDFRATGAGVIWFDAKNLKLWSGERILPTLYTFYVKIDDAYASQWGEDKCYLYTFNEGDDKWTSINGQCVRYDRRLADGVYKFIVRGQTSKGRMLFKNTAGASDMQEYSGTILPDDIRPRALYTISAKGSVTVAPEDYVENNVFEAGKAYYVDASAVAKDGKNWFENDNCTLGVKYDGDVHYGGTIVKVSTDPLVYRFTVNDDQTEIEVGRRNNQGLHNAVTVQAPTDGSNCIFLDGSTGVLKLDHLGTYSPAGGLYILGSSNTIAGDWKDATPIAMNYDETEDVFYYMVQGTNASPDYPIEFLISRGASNADFFKAENAFMPVREGYIHMAESDYMKGKPGYEDNKYFKLISRGRVMVRYIKDKDGIPTGVKIWYEPVVWPDLYILGSIIADPDDTQSVKSTHEQWETFGKLKMDEKQPGLYYYDLGLGDNKDLFNLQPYPVTGGAFGDIDEHGHFNFSFRGTGTDTKKFWDDAFVPATSTSMGTLNRDGVPVPFCYRDSKPDPDTKWVSTNFVFGERSRIWVDVVRQLVWIETFSKLSGNQAVFDFWDKGGTAYSKEDGYQWWSANDATTHNIQSYLVDETGNIIENSDSPYTLKPADLSWQALEVIDNVGSGVRYHFVANLPESYYEKDGEGNVTDKVANGYHVWIRIKDNANADHEILRPYAYQATYTQGPKDSNETLNYNYYGNIKAAGAPIVTIEPSVNMIYADVEAPEHLGHFRESHVMHYPYVNQYSTAVTVNPGNVYPFWVDGLTEEAKDESGNVIADQYVPVAGAPFTFTKSNQVTVSYGSIRETKYGTTGMAVIKGIDHANAAATDKMDVRVTYTSPGLIFARTKTEPLKIDANELPTMQNSKDTPLDVAAFYSGTACSEGLTVDLILHEEFAFRDIMTQGGEADGKIYTPRAAYLGYEVKIDADKVNDHSHVAEGHEHMAKNGVPLMWDFTDDHNRDIKGFTDLDKWHYEAYTGKSMAIQLHHVACGKTKADLESKSVTGTVTFHLYVPVATEFAFETGSTSLVRGMHKAGEQVNSKVLGDPNKPYTGSVSAKSYDSFTHNIDFSFAGNITTGVEGVGVEDAPVEFYNLQGVRMTSDTLAPGIYIRRQGNETSKVYIR